MFINPSRLIPRSIGGSYTEETAMARRSSKSLSLRGPRTAKGKRKLRELGKVSGNVGKDAARHFHKLITGPLAASWFCPGLCALGCSVGCGAVCVAGCAVDGPVPAIDPVGIAAGAAEAMTASTAYARTL
jgi:hypothetical protein